MVARWPGPASHMGRGLPHWSCTKGHLSPSNSWRNPLQQLRRAPEHSIHACHHSEPSGSVSLLPICSWDQAACALAVVHLCHWGLPGVEFSPARGTAALLVALLGTRVRSWGCPDGLVRSTPPHTHDALGVSLQKSSL